MGQPSEEDKFKAVVAFLRNDQGVNARYIRSHNKLPATFLVWIQQGVVPFKKLLPEHLYDPGGFYEVNLEYAYRQVIKRLRGRKVRPEES